MRKKKKKNILLVAFHIACGNNNILSIIGLNEIYHSN